MLILLLGCAIFDEPAKAYLPDSGDTAGETGAPDSGETGEDTEETGDSGEDTAPPEEPPVEVVLNEFMADNRWTLADDLGAYSDWIELYNPAAEDADLSGYYLSDDLEDPYVHKLPAGTVVPAGGWLLLWADGDPSLGASHLGFRLAEEGEEIGLFDPFGFALDRIQFGAQSPDIAAARFPDGGEEWEYLFRGTPGGTNDPPDLVDLTLLPPGSTWRYFDGADVTSGGDAGWEQPGFDDGGWASGAGPLGYGDKHIVTAIGYGPDPDNKYLVAWFRTTFDVADPAALQSVRMELMRDDGGVVYLNGAEVARVNLPEGELPAGTVSTATVGAPDESAYFWLDVDPAALVAGANTLAVAVYQVNATSSDLSFDLALIGQVYETE